LSKQDQYIGVFDSGVGGLSVFKELQNLLPNESFLYFADSANCPYGAKSQEEIINLSKSIVDFFLSEGVKLIVVACNTATAAAIDYLRENYDIPFVGMEPAIKPAALKTKKGSVGVLATEGTFNGRLFNQTSQKYASDIDVTVQIGEGFVELVEHAKFDTLEAENVVAKVVKPFVDKDIDQLVLACTHYPFLEGLIKKALGNKHIELINPAPSIAKQARNILIDNSLMSSLKNKRKHKFFSSSDDITTLKLLVKHIAPNLQAEFVSGLKL
jgi:glutamate racemase